MDLEPREYLRTAHFAPDEIDQRFPNARRILTEGIFVSHSGLDTRRIHEDIVLPVLHDRFADGIFFHSRTSGGAESYKQLVQAALHFCDKFIVVVSQNSITNPWVRAEAEWAAEHQRPVIHCLLDDSDPGLLYTALPPIAEAEGGQRVYGWVDFRGDIREAQTRLGTLLDELLSRYPYHRLTHLSG
jgi:hypothetical protein